MNDLSLTLLQLDILWQSPHDNRRQAEACMEAAHGSDIFLVPETFTTGFGGAMTRMAEPPEGDTLRWTQQMARQHNALVVGTWIVTEGERCYNRMHWVRPDGTYGTYDKAHLFRAGGEAQQLERGTEKVTFEWRGWRIRPAVCYDLRFPTWLRNSLAGGGADTQGHPYGDSLDYDLLLVCANWPASRRDAWSTLLKARAIENLAYVAGCNREGTDADGLVYGGDSAILDFKGKPIAAPGNAPCTLAATLSHTALEDFRRRWPFYLDFD